MGTSLTYNLMSPPSPENMYYGDLKYVDAFRTVFRDELSFFSSYFSTVPVSIDNTTLIRAVQTPGDMDSGRGGCCHLHAGQLRLYTVVDHCTCCPEHS